VFLTCFTRRKAFKRFGFHPEGANDGTTACAESAALVVEEARAAFLHRPGGPVSLR
jgi:hypothetical protein